jgi:hypothetical protein
MERLTGLYTTEKLLAACTPKALKEADKHG